MRRATGFRYVPQLSGVVAAILLAGVAISANNGFEGRFDRTKDAVAQIASEYPDQKAGQTVRVGSCFLSPGQDVRDFAPECLGKPSLADASNAVLIWGDSHAAHLYYGLRSVLPGGGTRLWQLTASSCPPLPGHESTQRSNCAEINRYVLQKVRQLRPAAVLMNAFWWRVPFSHFSQADLIRELPGDIAALKNSGVSRVIVVGPVPIFRTPQPKLIAFATVGSQIPLRLRPADLEMQRSLDAALQEVVTRSGARYVSPLSLECTTADCLVALTHQVSDVMAYDYGHLTQRGSEFLAQKLLVPELVSLRHKSDL